MAAKKIKKDLSKNGNWCKNCGYIFNWPLGIDGKAVNIYYDNSNMDDTPHVEFINCIKHLKSSIEELKSELESVRDEVRDIKYPDDHY